MSKANLLASQFLSKPEAKKPKESHNFNLVQSGPQNSFRNTFDIVPLEENLANEIEQLLIENSRVNSISKKNLSEDCKAIKSLTAEIKAINKQGLILLGERIQKARTILKKYGDGKGVFTKWLTHTFGNRRSAYNILSYYEFYQSLPTNKLKTKLKNMPVQAVYTLASREGSAEVKTSIVKEYNGEKQRDILLHIQNALPISNSDKRKGKSLNDYLIKQLEDIYSNIESQYGNLTREQKKHISECASKLVNLFQKNNKNILI